MEFQYGGKTYETDILGFLVAPEQWDENFARGMALKLGMSEGLTEEHWKVIRFLRAAAKETGRCPLVYQTCRQNNLKLADLGRLFPTGYLRGACKLAGLTYLEGVTTEPRVTAAEPARVGGIQEKTYRVNATGFLRDPSEWDEKFAAGKAAELGIASQLTEAHWKVIHFLRDEHARTGIVPTVVETCSKCGLEIDQLEKLFPSGYHRGAVKIAGLRVL